MKTVTIILNKNIEIEVITSSS